MTSLLPISATPQERAVEGVISRLSDVPILVRESWNPDTCPVALLPWLAWALSVDNWNPAWSEAAKRAVIRESFYVHSTKGTVASIRRIFDAMGFGDVFIDEGRGDFVHDGTIDYDGGATYGDEASWAEYRVRLFKLLSNSQADEARALLASAAPLRCHLFSLDFTDAALLYNSEATYDGSFNHGVA